MPNTHKILVVEDDTNFRTLISDLLRDEGYAVTGVESGEEALEVLHSPDGRPDLILLDLRLPGMDGMGVLEAVMKLDPSIAVVMISGHGDIETAVHAVRLGAYDFLVKPVESERLLITVRRALDYLDVRREKERLLSSVRERFKLIGISPAMKRILDVVERVSQTTVSVLITGESGTGKEMVARAIHFNSPRSGKPFVMVNCAAIPESLAESELFGHVKGAFTGAIHSHEGKFQRARGGTLFLDEIGDLSLPIQAKLLRALEDRTVTKVGGEHSESVDVRFIAATRHDLLQMVRERKFREDLYHRINVVNIHIPPLRQRPGDIIPLAEHFLRQFAADYGKKAPRLRPDAQAVLLSHSWPGNVRELRNLMEKVIVLTDLEELHGSVLADLIENPIFPAKAGQNIGFHEAREAFERSYIIAQLRAHGWNISKTAKTMGIERSYLYKLMDRLGIREAGPAEESPPRRKASRRFH